MFRKAYAMLQNLNLIIDSKVIFSQNWLAETRNVRLSKHALYPSSKACQCQLNSLGWPG